MSFIIDDVFELYAQYGQREYAGEGVTQTEHALQCATLAHAAGAGDEMIAAALLHDIGHLLNDQGETPTLRKVDDLHQYAGIPFLRQLFGEAVIEPIRLHVEAKRYLCGTDPAYFQALSADSRRSLVLQGGAHTFGEAEQFIAKPFAPEAVRLRRWDDQAKVGGRIVPLMRDFEALLYQCAGQAVPVRSVL